MTIRDLTDTDKKILTTIRKYPDSNRTRTAELAGIVWSTATTSIDKLIRLRMVRNEKKLLRVNKEYGYFLGVSIGTSHIYVCVLDFSFGFVPRKDILALLPGGSDYAEAFWTRNGFRTLPDDGSAIWCSGTPSNGLFNVKQLMEELCGFALALNEKARVLSVGFSFPGHVDNKNNIVLQSTNLQFDLKMVGENALFSNETLRRMKDPDPEKEISLCFEHNVKAAAIAEKCTGCLREQDGNCAVLFLGAGLGIAFWLDGKLYRGRTNAAGSRFGHMKIDYDPGSVPEKCSCGEYGCLEQTIRSLFPDKDFVREKNGRELAQWLKEKEHEPVTRRFVEYLSRALFNISSLLEIDVIVFSGKLANLYEGIEALFQEKLIQFHQANIRILTSTLGETAAATGAAICGYYTLTQEPVE